MENLTLIIALSAVLWFIVDKFKPLWAEKSWGKYITMAVAAIGCFGLTFAFDLDIIFASGLFDTITPAGQIMTGLVLMSGSSAVAEVIARIKGEPQIVTDTRDDNLDE